MNDFPIHAFRHTPREHLTDQERAKLFLERGGRCHKCGRKLGPADKWIAEHIIALSSGGTNAWSNWGITCAWCLPAKNAEDAAKVAKGRAIAVAHIVPTDQRMKRGPPLPGSRRSKWKRKMNGTWERRE